jgi:hypothetical protein
LYKSSPSSERQRRDFIINTLVDNNGDAEIDRSNETYHYHSISSLSLITDKMMFRNGAYAPLELKISSLVIGIESALPKVLKGILMMILKCLLLIGSQFAIVGIHSTPLLKSAVGEISLLNCRKIKEHYNDGKEI